MAGAIRQFWGIDSPERELKQSVAILEQLATQTNPKRLALSMYAGCRRLGDECEKDDKLAFHLYSEAANQGLSEAMMVVGYSYQNAMGVERDSKEAVSWYRRAVYFGNNPFALYSLSCCYSLNHCGSEQEDKNGVCFFFFSILLLFVWYHRVVSFGNNPFAYNLGLCYSLNYCGSENKKNGIC